MIVEVTGAGFHNMGAELMLRAARHKVLSWDYVDGVAINFRIGTNAQRRDLGVGSIVGLGKNRPPIVRRTVGFAVRSTPAGLKQAAGVHHPDDGGALLDASGFAFGDQWGPSAAEGRASEYERYSQRDRPVVLLPQAFGPFTEPGVAQASRRAINMADLVFARDPESVRHLQTLDLDGPAVALAPDFTNLLQAPPSSSERRTVAVIPNYRVPEKVESVSEGDYTGFLNACIEAVGASGHEVTVLAHEPGDVTIAGQLAAAARQPIELAKIEDPITAKALVGSSWLTISSRYHGAVNSLSQCVPTIGTSWSHKYEYLFADYGCKDGLWPIDATDVAARLGEWLTPEGRRQRAQHLEEPAAIQEAESEAMWGRVEALLRSRL